MRSQPGLCAAALVLLATWSAAASAATDERFDCKLDDRATAEREALPFSIMRTEPAPQKNRVNFRMHDPHGLYGAIASPTVALVSRAEHHSQINLLESDGAGGHRDRLTTGLAIDPWDTSPLTVGRLMKAPKNRSRIILMGGDPQREFFGLCDVFKGKGLPMPGESRTFQAVKGVRG